MVHDALFPLNPQPRGIAELMKRFRGGAAVYDFVRWQLVAGAKAALAFARAHNPGLNLKVIGMGPPAAPDGRPMAMGGHYTSATEAAESIAMLVDEETDRIRQRREGL